MQVTFQVAVRCDFQDRGKYAEVWKSMLEGATFLYTQALLLQQADAPSPDKVIQPQVEIGSDDIWHGTKVVKSLAALIQEADKQGIAFEVTDEVLDKLGVEIPR